jgi:hypothetical protein
VFRAKNRKDWKLSDKTLEAINMLDSVIREEEPESIGPTEES